MRFSVVNITDSSIRVLIDGSIAITLTVTRQGNEYRVIVPSVVFIQDGELYGNLVRFAKRMFLSYHEIYPAVK